MAKSLVITEKPSVASDIAKVIGGFQEEDGYFENDDYLVTFAVGHLFELLPPEEVDEKYKRWTLDALPILVDEYKYRPKKGQSERIRTIRKLHDRDDVDTVVNACDAGREGELIFREIVDHFGSTKPVRRLWLQSMTDQSIRRGFTELRPGEELEGLADAARCRAQTDWLIGMNATRALTKRLKSRKEKTAWSAGRVQTPTLAMLVEREQEVLAHVPRPYWRVAGTFDHAGNAYTGTWFDPAFTAGADEEARDDRIFEEARAQAIVAAVNGLAGTATETRKPSKESAPPLFDLTSLQREANRRFSWSARRTLSGAQRLYERHKALTYPRTDSRCLPEDYRETVDQTLASFAAESAREGFESYAASAAHLVEAGLENTKRVFDNKGISDHFAIIPTGTIPDELTGDDARLFDLVVRRFLGTFYPPAQWERVERTTEVAGNSFRTRDRFLKEQGWRAVLAPTEGEETERLAPLGGAADARAAIATTQAESVEEETKPPARITEARLLSLMENAGRQVEDEGFAAALSEKGIGTPATRADIIENLIAKSYAVRIDKALRPTVKGIRLIDTLRRINIERLTSAALTGEIESHLREVEIGTRSASDFMREITDYAVDIVNVAKTFEYDELYDTNESLGLCPKCQKPVIEMAWFYRCEPIEGQEREDECPMRFWKDTSGRYLDRNSVKALIKDGKTGTLDGFTARNGRTYKGFIEILTDEWTLKVRSLGWNEGEGVNDQPEYDVNPDPLGPCPFEQECAIVETPTQFICERKFKEEELAKNGTPPAEGDIPKSCGFVFPRTVCKREVTRDEADVYLKTGRSELLTDFTSRFGRPFSATLVLKENGRHGFEFQPRGKAADGEAPKAAAKKTAKKKATKKKAKKKAAKKTSKKATAKKTTSKKAASKKASGKKTTAKVTGGQKAPRRKSPAKKVATASSDS